MRKTTNMITLVVTFWATLQVCAAFQATAGTIMEEWECRAFDMSQSYDPETGTFRLPDQSEPPITLRRRDNASKATTIGTIPGGTEPRLLIHNGGGEIVLKGTVQSADFVMEADNQIVGRTGTRAIYERKWQWSTMRGQTRTYSMFTLSPRARIEGVYGSRGYPYHDGFYNQHGQHGTNLRTYECLQTGP